MQLLVGVSQSEIQSGFFQEGDIVRGEFGFGIGNESGEASAGVMFDTVLATSDEDLEDEIGNQTRYGVYAIMSIMNSKDKTGIGRLKLKLLTDGSDFSAGVGFGIKLGKRHN